VNVALPGEVPANVIARVFEGGVPDGRACRRFLLVSLDRWFSEVAIGQHSLNESVSLGELKAAKIAGDEARPLITSADEIELLVIDLCLLLLGGTRSRDALGAGDTVTSFLGH
jgi:hypothetical protein